MSLFGTFYVPVLLYKLLHSGSWQPCLKVSTTTNFKIKKKIKSFIVLGGLKCEKLANNVRLMEHQRYAFCKLYKLITLLETLLLKY